MNTSWFVGRLVVLPTAFGRVSPASLADAAIQGDATACDRPTPHPIDVPFATAERSGRITVDLLDAQSVAHMAWTKELDRGICVFRA